MYVCMPTQFLYTIITSNSLMYFQCYSETWYHICFDRHDCLAQRKFLFYLSCNIFPNNCYDLQVKPMLILIMNMFNYIAQFQKCDINLPLLFQRADHQISVWINTSMLKGKCCCCTDKMCGLVSNLFKSVCITKAH